MAFDLDTILIFVAASIFYMVFIPAQWRSWIVMVGSVIVIYWLQPVLPIRFSGYIFPTLMLGLIVLCWWISRLPNDAEQQATIHQDRKALVIVVVIIISLSFFRYFDIDYQFLANRPPAPITIISTLAVTGVVFAGGSQMIRGQQHHRLLSLSILLLITIFLFLKTEPLAVQVSKLWRVQTQQDSTLASIVDLNWIGFSYVAFRLIHTLRDRQMGILPVLSLREYVTYVIFFPSYIAGPIDRVERFVIDFRNLPTIVGLDPVRFYDGIKRIGYGLLYKFVIADSLAQGAALTPLSATQVQSTPGLWLLLYGYGLRLFFDFCGYTHIAIGIGILLGFQLPENFKRPYLTTNITTFWQSWHITLSDWVRFYVFSPLSRWLLRRKPRPSPTLIVFCTQLITMIIIGLWHGITWNYFIWGLWHGVGLFIHKQWSQYTRRWFRKAQAHPWRRRVWYTAAWFINFHFITIGWIWFALPDTRLALHTFARLFGWSMP